MKHYLDLVSISRKLHKRKNRMSVFCIILSVFLVTVIFGMVDMFIQSQVIQAKKDSGNWHISIVKINDEEAALIGARPEIIAAPRYGVKNFRRDEGYFLSGKDAIIVGCDESFITDILDEPTEGRFPQSDTEAMLTKSTRNRLGLKIGDSFSLKTPEGRSQYTVSGFCGDTMKTMGDDAYGVVLATNTFRSFFPDKESRELEDYDSSLFIRFSDHLKIQHTIEDLKDQFDLLDDQVVENVKLLGLTGQSRNDFMLKIYGVAVILFILVMIAGILMISGSLNSDVIQRTEFFGMVRCIGATPKQIMKLVQREAMSWCRFAVPCGIAVGVCLNWLLCAVLRVLSPIYFGELPVFKVSLPGVLMGAIVGFLTVFFAAGSPAKKASRVSPLTAALGNAHYLAPVRKAARTRLFKIETALGIHHATAGKKNFLLMVGSFGISIILFLSFSVTVDFMNHALTPLRPSAPDISISSKDETCSVDCELLEKLENHPAVKRAFGRRFAYEIPAEINGKKKNVDLISYEDCQFQWADKDLTEGSLHTVQKEMSSVACTYQLSEMLKVGDTVKIEVNGEKKEVRVGAMLSNLPFDNEEGVMVCSEDTFQMLTGERDYTIVDLQLKSRENDSEVEEIHDIVGDNFKFSDQRMSNQSVRGASYSFSLCVYGFLVLIAMITVFHIINSIAMSVAARIRQYGAFRAIGLTSRQLMKMIIAEAFSYGLTGTIFGCVFGIFFHRLIFLQLITSHWGDPWKMPCEELLIIVVIMFLSMVFAVKNPMKRIRKLSITETINAQ